MHEFSIAQSIVEKVQKHVPVNQKQGIRSVKLKLGDLAGIVPESLMFCFEAVSNGTIAQGAQLEIEKIPAVYHCGKCGSFFEDGRYMTLCASCGENVELISGNELDVTEVEFDD